jgi:hypothetical protein
VSFGVVECELHRACTDDLASTVCPTALNVDVELRKMARPILPMTLRWIRLQGTR